MEVMGLAGMPDSGKTTTIGLVYEKLLSMGYEEDQACYKDLYNKDFLAVLIEPKSKLRVGIISQGDYIKWIRAYLRLMNQTHNCSVSICACTLEPKGDKKRACIEEYPHLFIEKAKIETASEEDYALANNKVAEDIINALEEKIKLIISKN